MTTITVESTQDVLILAHNLSQAGYRAWIVRDAYDEYHRIECSVPVNCVDAIARRVNFTRYTVSEPVTA